jgi:hypothetical protein
MSIKVESASIPEVAPTTVEAPKEEAKESAAPEKEAETTEDSETPESEQETQEEQEEATEGDELKEEKPKKKNGFQKRVDKLNKRISDKEREAEYWKAEALKLKPQETKPETAQAKSDDEPNPDNFESHLDWVKEWNRWDRKREQKESEAKQKEEQLKTEEQKARSTFVEKAEKFKEEHPDYDDVLKEVDDAGIRIPFALETILLGREPELAYELAKNHEELSRIAKLPYGEMAYELGKFEARIQSSSDQKQEIKTTKAPAPINPVGSKGSGAPRKTLHEVAKEGSQREYEEWRAKQAASKRA